MKWVDLKYIYRLLYGAYGLGLVLWVSALVLVSMYLKDMSKTTTAVKRSVETTLYGCTIE